MTQPFTHKDLEAYQLLLSILVMGPAGSGKSHAILNLAETWQTIKPDGKIRVIDAEAGVPVLWKPLFPHVHNVDLWLAGRDFNDIDSFLEVFREVYPKCNADDWLCIESDTRVWDAAQDSAWLRVTGRHKDSYLSERLASSKKMPVTPHPDNLWQVALDYYRRQFRDVLVNEVKSRTNILVTTGVSRPGGTLSAARKTAMDFLNVQDIVPDGHAENVRNLNAVVLLLNERDEFWAYVLKDRGYRKRKFKVESLYLDFISSRE